MWRRRRRVGRANCGNTSSVASLCLSMLSGFIPVELASKRLLEPCSSRAYSAATYQAQRETLGLVPFLLASGTLMRSLEFGVSAPGHAVTSDRAC